MSLLRTKKTDKHCEGKLLYNLQEAAHKLGISEWTIRRLIRRGLLMPVRIGSRRLVPATELSAYVTRLQEQELAS